MMASGVSIRSSPRFAAGVAAGLLGGALLSSSCSDHPGPGSLGSAPLRVYGLQLHLHGSLSEGPASMAAHDAAAAALAPAVDVLWWTDHSWRVHGYTYVDGFDFEQGLSNDELVPRQPSIDELERIERTQTRSARPEELAALGIEREVSSKKGWHRRQLADQPALAHVEVSAERARAGERSLRIEAVSDGPRSRTVALDFHADRRRHIASLASGVKLRLSVWAETTDPNARVVLALDLSQQTPDLRVRLEYSMSASGDGRELGAPSTTDLPSPGDGETTRLIRIPVHLMPGQWNDLEFDLSADAIAHDLGGADNSLAGITLRVDVRRRAAAVFFVDEFEIVRERKGDPLFAWARHRASELSNDDRVHHVGQEISFGAHLNAYGADLPLLDPALNPNGLSASEAVAFAHRHGGLVSLNHFFGVEVGLSRSTTPESLERLSKRMDELVSQRAYGVDLLEVGYRERGRDLAAYLESWDRLSEGGVYATGIGVSDSHDARRGWSQGPNNFITWVYARSRNQGDLLEGLRAGRAYFGDPNRFGGRIELGIPDVADMGAVIRRGREESVVEARVSGLRDGQRVFWVEDGLRVEARRPNEGTFVDRRRVSAEPGIDFLRLEVHDEEGPVALSNPIYWTRGDGPKLPPWRAASKRRALVAPDAATPP
jgi:hypothetical protein